MIDVTTPVRLPAQRLAMWGRVDATPCFDLAVIGGGATGLGIALEASLRGCSVALFESHDFASGTSSRSTKLLHGGVRYLAQGRLPLVREALAERATILRIAPGLARPLAFVLPVYRWSAGAFYGAGLKLYDALAVGGRGAGLGPTEFLSRAETLRRLPGVRAEGLLGGIQYWDAQFDDARLAVALARSAADAGAAVLNHAPVTGLLQAPAGSGRANRIAGVCVRDAVDGGERAVQARCVVNATGVWVDDIRRLEGGPAAAGGDLVTSSQGVHLVVERPGLPTDCALLVPRTRDGRVLFAVPWQGRLLLGTTDTPRSDHPREPAPLSEEVDFILTEASRALALPVTHADVRSAWAGLRPLVRSGKAAGAVDVDTRRVSREHAVSTSPGGLISVTGGKWTTYRAMAADVLHHAAVTGRLPPWAARASGSEWHRLRVDSPFVGWVPATSGVGAETERLLAPGLSAAMLHWAVHCEFALTVEDVLARRSRLLFLDAGSALRAAPRVAVELAALTGRDPGLAGFEALARRYAGGASSAATLLDEQKLSVR